MAYRDDVDALARKRVLEADEVALHAAFRRSGGARFVRIFAVVVLIAVAVVILARIESPRRSNDPQVGEMMQRALIDAQRALDRERTAVVRRPTKVLYVEGWIDVPDYPRPRTPARKDAGRILQGIERTVQAELDRFAACSKKPEVAVVMVECTIDGAGRAHDLRTGTSLTAVDKNPARDNCVGDVIRRMRFPEQGRARLVGLKFAFRSD